MGLAMLLAVALLFIHADFDLAADAFFAIAVGLACQCCNDETDNRVKEN